MMKTLGSLSFANKLTRVVWQFVWLVGFRPTPVFLHGWRRFLLRLFGAHIAGSARVYPSTRIWAPWNLQMAPHSCLGPFVDCYSVAKISLGTRALVSQYSFLCSASHDYNVPQLPLVVGPIAIGDKAWVAADAFVGLGVTIGEGAVVGARSVVTRDVAAWTVVAGHPAQELKKRSPF